MKPQNNTQLELVTGEVRKAGERGVADFDWLNSLHTFSFADYYDPKFMGYGPLRVINEDRIQPGRGFGTHGHKDMEIISYVIKGELEHKDNTGTSSIIYPGDVQRMSAGTGVQHSEYNPSKTDLVHFLQIWIIPDKEGIEPSYEQKTFSNKEKSGQLRLVGSRDGRNGSVTIHQDADLYATVLRTGEEVEHQIAENRHIWAQVVSGEAMLNGSVLDAGDAYFVQTGGKLVLSGKSEETEILLFDMG